MNLQEYQDIARQTAIYPAQYKLIYPSLGLCGEAGEVAEKVKKSIRDHVDNTYQIILELGDVLWYLANIASDLDISLDEVAQRNISKLQSRADRNKLQGNGDNR